MVGNIEELRYDLKMEAFLNFWTVLAVAIDFGAPGGLPPEAHWFGAGGRGCARTRCLPP